MCIQYFHYYRCGHSAADNFPCRRIKPENRSDPIKLSCPSYTGHRATTTDKCGLGRFYCREENETAKKFDPIFDKLMGLSVEIIWYNKELAKLKNPAQPEEAKPDDQFAELEQKRTELVKKNDECHRQVEVAKVSRITTRHNEPRPQFRFYEFGEISFQEEYERNAHTHVALLKSPRLAKLVPPTNYDIPHDAVDDQSGRAQESARKKRNADKMAKEPASKARRVEDSSQSPRRTRAHAKRVNYAESPSSEHAAEGPSQPVPASSAHQRMSEWNRRENAPLPRDLTFAQYGDGSLNAPHPGGFSNAGVPLQGPHNNAGGENLHTGPPISHLPPRPNYPHLNIPYANTRARNVQHPVVLEQNNFGPTPSLHTQSLELRLRLQRRSLDVDAYRSSELGVTDPWKHRTIPFTGHPTFSRNTSFAPTRETTVPRHMHIESGFRANAFYPAVVHHPGFYNGGNVYGHPNVPFHAPRFVTNAPVAQFPIQPGQANPGFDPRYGFNVRMAFNPTSMEPMIPMVPTNTVFPAQTVANPSNAPFVPPVNPAVPTNTGFAPHASNDAANALDDQTVANTTVMVSNIPFTSVNTGITDTGDNNSPDDEAAINEFLTWQL